MTISSFSVLKKKCMRTFDIEFVLLSIIPETGKKVIKSIGRLLLNHKSKT